jgi:hypothetical protein
VRQRHPPDASPIVPSSEQCSLINPIIRRRPRSGLHPLRPRLPQLVPLLPLLHRRVCTSTASRSLRLQNTPSSQTDHRHRLLIQGADTEIAQAVDVTDRLTEALKDCPTKSYIVVQQHGVSPADYIDSHAAPQLSHYVGGSNQKIRSTMIIPEVISSTSKINKMATPAQSIADYIQQHCGAVDPEDTTGPVSKDATTISIYTAEAPKSKQDFSKTGQLRDII